MKDLRDGDDLANFVEKGAARRSPIGWLVAHGVLWGALLGELALVRGLEVVYRDFGVDLAWATAFVIRASRLGFVLVAPVLALLVADWFLLLALVRRGAARGYRAWSRGMLFAPILLSAAMIAAVAVPLFTITTRLRG